MGLWYRAILQMQYVGQKMANQDGRNERCLEAVYNYFEEKFDNIERRQNDIEHATILRDIRNKLEITILEGCKIVRTAYKMISEEKTNSSKINEFRNRCQMYSPLIAIAHFKEKTNVLFDKIIENTDHSELLFDTLGLEYLEDAAVCAAMTNRCIKHSHSASENRSEDHAEEAMRYFNESVVTFLLKKASLNATNDVIKLSHKLHREHPPAVSIRAKTF